MRMISAADPAAAASVGEELLYLLVYFLEFLADELTDPGLAFQHWSAMEWDRVRSPETCALAPIYLSMMLEVREHASSAGSASQGSDWRKGRGG